MRSISISERILFTIVATVATFLPCYYFSNVWQIVAVPLGAPALSIVTVFVLMLSKELLFSNSAASAATNKRMEEGPWDYLFTQQVYYLMIWGIIHIAIAIGM